MVRILQKGLDNSLFLDKKRVVYLHGISDQEQIPLSVKSLEGVPAHITIPVACGKLEKQNGSFLPF
ncbi:MAG: hypothetical protein JW915_23170 [Chitinispirillaceae bacterium]|nr:hypothetical protein [Chitinispirillaceae bacterium]